MSNSIITKNLNWHKQLRSKLEDLDIECHFFIDDKFNVLSLNDGKKVIHLIDIDNDFRPADLINLQEKYLETGVKLIHLWEDVWLTKSTQVLARIGSLQGLNARIHGRKTQVKKIIKPIAEAFLNDNHLQGYVSSRYKLGLFESDQLVAVATFSALRKMKHTENYASAELIRFAVKAGCSVTGGLSKLISYFFEFQKPNDLMTYADRDWSAGEAYIKLGFILTDYIEPKQFEINEDLNRSLKKMKLFLIE